MNVPCTRIHASVNFPIMKTSVSDLRSGNLVEFRGTIWRIVRKLVVEKTRGESLQIQMRGVLKDVGLDERFRSKDELEKIHTEQRSVFFRHKLLADNGDFYLFRDAEKGGDWILHTKFIHGWPLDAQGETPWVVDKGSADFLYIHCGHDYGVMMNFYNGEPVGIEHPESVVIEVRQTQELMWKGLGLDVTKKKTYKMLGFDAPPLSLNPKEKRVELWGGHWLSVPPSVNVGDKIRVNTDTGEYVESVKN